MSSRNKNIFVASSMSQLIQKVYIGELKMFDFIIIDSDKQELFDLVDDISKKVDIPHRIIKLEKKHMVLNQSAVLFFDGIDSYQNSNLRLNGSLQKKYCFTVYILGHFEGDFNIHLKKTKLSRRQNHIFQFQNFIVCENELIKLITFEIFTQPNCRDWNEVEINRFSKHTKQWRNQNFVIEKFKQYNKCRLVGVAYYHSPEVFLSKGQKDKVTGYAPRIYREIGKALNYTFFLISVKKKTKDGEIRYGDFFMILTSMRQRSSRGSPGITTFPIAVTNFILQVSRFQPYTYYDKMIMPFETRVWLWIFTCLVIYYTLNFVMRKLKENIEIFSLVELISTTNLT